MKTAEEICQSMRLQSLHKREISILKQALLDSFKAGERFAAEWPDDNGRTYGKELRRKQAILTDANNRTTLPVDNSGK